MNSDENKRKVVNVMIHQMGLQLIEKVNEEEQDNCEDSVEVVKKTELSSRRL